MDPRAELERAVTLHRQGQSAEAETILRRLLAIQPGQPLVNYLLGGICCERGDHAEALALIDVALKARPGNPGALFLAGNALQGLGRMQEAVARYDAVLSGQPDNADAFNNRGNALGALDRHQEAMASFDAAVAAEPDNPLFRYNRANQLLKLMQLDAAIADFDRVVALQPENVAARGNRGSTLVSLGRADLALADFDAVLAQQPRNLQALINRAAALMHLQRYAEALTSYDDILRMDPHFPRVLGQVAIAAMHECDWPRMAALGPAYRQAVQEDAEGLDPLSLINYGGDGALMLRCARTALDGKLAHALPAPLWTGQRYNHARLRIAYVSSDLHGHPVGYLMAPLLERHDRDRFEIIVISTGQADGGTVRERIMAAADHFHDMGQCDDRAVAQKLRELETDIAVDLHGHTYGGRFGAFAFRPAPVQATWLGYPGTTGADFMDYILADAVVAPPEHQPFYSEKIAHLPACVFPFDVERAIAATPSRAEEGLPETGFVFCCFNRNWKITDAVFDIWMRLLQQVPGSVLWLGDYLPHIQQKLREEAQARDVDPARLIFAQKRNIAEHLARHRLADLFLDTLPYNAHATAADALLAGLPVVTQLGNIFAGRVSTSMAIAAGVPELVTQTAEDYEALALALARDPARLAALRDKLDRREGPLFDSVGFVRGLEAAYLRMSGAQ